jgi:hypothetical protein
MVAVFNRDRTKPSDFTEFSYPAYIDLRDRSGVFASVMAHSFTTVGIRDGRLHAPGVRHRRLLELLRDARRVAARRPSVHGRRGAARRRRRVAIASYTQWRKRQFDAGFIGSTVRINGRDFTVVGVTPRGFAGPFAFVSPQWWLPIGAYETITNEMFKDRATGLMDRQNYALNLAGVLKPGVTRSMAGPALDAFAAASEPSIRAAIATGRS